MNSKPRNLLSAVLCGVMLAAGGLGSGCVVHTNGEVELVDDQGYHHKGYYDDHHDWHGGYYDEHHVWHDDDAHWHR